jgi:hypothetical protein
LLTDAGKRISGEAEWLSAGKPGELEIAWNELRPPSGFLVRWDGSAADAWLPINVLNSASLPPPEELRDLPLDVLIDILTSARPLHQVMRAYLMRKKRAGLNGAVNTIEILDPHKKVDVSGFLLQRTRRVSWALQGLRRRLERPVTSKDALKWRLYGPVGVMALAQALEKEAKTQEEKGFLISELILELFRAHPQAAAGCLTPVVTRAPIRETISDFKKQVSNLGLPRGTSLQRYIKAVFQAVESY